VGEIDIDQKVSVRRLEGEREKQHKRNGGKRKKTGKSRVTGGIKCHLSKKGGRVGGSRDVLRSLGLFSEHLTKEKKKGGGHGEKGAKLKTKK